MPKISKIYIGTNQVYPPQPPRFYFKASANGSILLRRNGSPTSITLEFSTDGNNYHPFNISTGYGLSANTKFYIRNTSTTDTGFSTSDSNYYSFEISCNGGTVECGGEIGFLLNKESTTTLTGNYCFYKLFYNNSKLITAPILNATTLTSNCYQGMFSGCSNLTAAPDLPATTMQTNCYYDMFYNCTSLVTCGSLQATSLASQCYYEMFYGCSNLITLPTLGATGSIPSRAYNGMFYNCSKIKLSQTQTGEYQTGYRIPPVGSASWNIFGQVTSGMFTNTGGSWAGTPSANTTYYTSNTLV